MFLNTDSKYIWMNGDFHKWNDANIHLLTHTLHYGLGVFEGVRAYSNKDGGAIFRLTEHTDRLYKAANKVNIKIPYGQDELNDLQKEVLLKNNLNEAYIRPIVFLGAEEMGLRATNLSINLAIACWEWPSYMDPKTKELGLSIVTSPFKQYENSLYSSNKIIGSYVNSIMALHDAISRDADEALLLDSKGHISEGSGENIFIVKDKTLLTPTTKNCLNGITRQSIIELAESFDISVKECELEYDELISADEAFFTGTAVEVTPITKVDDSIIGSGSIGPITKQLQETYTKIVTGENNNYSHWLHPIK